MMMAPRITTRPPHSGESNFDIRDDYVIDRGTREAHRLPRVPAPLKKRLRSTPITRMYSAAKRPGSQSTSSKSRFLNDLSLILSM